MLGETIRKLREQRGLTQDRLADQIGLSAMAIQYYEDNMWRPGSGTIVKLAEALDVSIADLVGECKIVCDENGDLLYLKDIGGGRCSLIGVNRLRPQAASPAVSS